ncbi:MAG: DUF4234 domain-containing protein [Candidatus Electrothrix sp. AR1]|nr:DUF4234 domain-containing protein [Candidatus Electrothrix sp. AR1]
MGDISTHTEIAVKQDIKNTPVILTVFFTVITAGIYYPCWFLTRRNQINKLHSREKLSKGFFILGIVIYSISLLLACGSGVFEGIQEANGTAEFLKIAEGLDSVDKFLTLFISIIMIMQSFKVKRIFQDHFDDYLRRNVSFSGLATFFFGIYYLQYKINKFEKYEEVVK